jgi:cold shock CspA family protein
MQIHWSHVDKVDPEEREAIEARIRELAEGHNDLIDLRIVGRRTRHHRQGAEEIRIACQARGKEIVVTRTQEEMGLALNEALDVFEREVRRLRDKRVTRRMERVAAPPHLGLVDRLFPDEGYGFILTDAGEQVYFHRNAVTDGLEFEALEEGQRVGLNVEQGDDGAQATSVIPVPPDIPSP